MTRPKTDANARTNEAQILEVRLGEILAAIRRLNNDRTMSRAEITLHRKALQSEYDMLSKRYRKATGG